MLTNRFGNVFKQKKYCERDIKVKNEMSIENSPLFEFSLEAW